MRVITRCFVGLTLFLSFARPASAVDVLSIDNASVREAPPGMKVTAGYARLSNTGPDDITVTGASSDAFERVEIHLSSVADGVAMMLPQSALLIPAGEQREFKAGGYHLMLIGANTPFREGDTVMITLHTSVGDVVAVYTVKRY